MTPLFAEAVTAAGEEVPPEKQALLDATPSAEAPDADDSAAGGVSPVKSPVADSGQNKDISAIKTAVPNLQLKFNQAQTLSADQAIRVDEAQAISADVYSASSRGTDAFVSEALAAESTSQQTSTTTVSSFRIKMVDVFDSAVVVSESTKLSDQMLQDAETTDMPSLVSTSFSVQTWQGVQVSGTTATAVAVGSYTNCFQGGAFTESECVTDDPVQWQLSLQRGTDGIWRLTKRRGYSVDPALVEDVTGTPPPGETPPASPPASPTASPSGGGA